MKSARTPFPATPTGQRAPESYPFGFGRLKPWQVYLFATATTALTLWLRIAMDDLLDGRPTLVLFVLPILLSAYMGGLRGGLLATVLSYLGASYYLLPPIHSFAVASSAERWQQFFLALAGVAISVVNEALHRARHRADIATTEIRRTESIVRASEGRLRMATDNARVGLVMVDREHRYSFVNSTYAEILGLPTSDIVGQRVADVLPALYEEQIRPRLDRAFAGERVAYELHRPAPDGAHHYVVRYEPTEVDGSVCLVVVVITDITELKQAERAARMLAAIVESSDDAIIGKTLDGIITSWNSGAERVFGYSRNEAVGQSMLMLFPPERYDEEPRIIAQIVRGHSIDHFETQRVRKDGEIIHVSATISPILDDTGRIVGASKIARDITSRKLAEVTLRQASEELRESERRFSAMLGNVELASVMLDRQARITFCNDYLLALTGWQREEVMGRNWFELFIPSQYGDGNDFFATLLDKTTDTWHRDNQILTRTGALRQMRWHNVVLRAVTGEVIGSASLGEDITERKLAEIKIERLNRLYVVLSGINTLIVRAQDREELFREACRIAVEKGNFSIAWIGIVDGASLKVPLAVWAGPAGAYRDRIETVLREVALADTPAGPIVAEAKVLVFNDIATDVGMRAREEALAAGIRSLISLPICIAGKVVGLFTLGAKQVGFFDDEELRLLDELAGDISFALDHLQKSEKLDYLAYYDVLTGLANRSLFLERVALHMRAAASEGHGLAVFLVDLERFKNINDNLGQLAGDLLLKQVAEWMTRNLGDVDLLARIGADHFAVVLPKVATDGDVTSLVGKTMATFMEQPFRLNDSVFRIAAKAGVALFPADGDNADALFKHAEAALKQAKAHGDRYLFYTRTMTDNVANKPNLESQLRQALDNEEFVLHYQPKVDLASNVLVGAEALIRWNDPRTGLVPPFRFIPILEETGLIYEVGRWAMHKAIGDYMRWLSAGLQAPRIAVNVSPLQLRNRGFISEVEQAIAVDAYAPAGLELEITEGMVMEDIKQSIATLQTIRALGVSIAIDDFGTGFSSLGYLSKLPVDTLKIDRSFIIDMTEGPQGLALVSTIINLARSLGLKVVAEGVETEEQRRLLRLLNCDQMQGYLFSKPVPAEEFEAKFLSRTTLPANRK